MSCMGTCTSAGLGTAQTHSAATVAALWTGCKLQGGACIAYVRNVAVDTKHCRRALGTKLLEAARQLAANQWQATQACAHVEHGNEVRHAHGKLWRNAAIVSFWNNRMTGGACCRLLENCTSSAAIAR